MSDKVVAKIRHAADGSCDDCELCWTGIESVGCALQRSDPVADHFNVKPGPTCPGPGEYVLVPAEKWKAAWGLYLAHCPEVGDERDGDDGGPPLLSIGNVEVPGPGKGRNR